MDIFLITLVVLFSIYVIYNTANDVIKRKEEERGIKEGRLFTCSDGVARSKNEYDLDKKRNNLDYKYLLNKNLYKKDYLDYLSINQIIELCKPFREKEEIQKKEQERKNIIIQKATELRDNEIIRFTQNNLSNINLLYKVSPYEFEDIIAELYVRLGYDVIQTKYSNDKGKDIILTKNGIKYLVECKKYDTGNTIGREALQKFFAAIIEENAEKGFLVTTSDFKSTAIQYANDIGKIELINGNSLVLMMRNVYPEKYEDNLVKIMCQECGDIVKFIFKDNQTTKNCINGHTVINDFNSETLSPKSLINNNYTKELSGNNSDKNYRSGVTTPVGKLAIGSLVAGGNFTFESEGLVLCAIITTNAGCYDVEVLASDLKRCAEQHQLSIVKSGTQMIQGEGYLFRMFRGKLICFPKVRNN